MNMMGGSFIPAPSPWTDERIAVLRQMWGEGYSASVIAGHLGFGITRNSVIGKAHRLGLVGHGSPTRAKRKPSQRQKRPPAPVLAFKPVPPAPAAPVAVVEPVETIPGPVGGVTIADLGHNHCRWIDGEPTADARYCGASVRPGRSYCDEHHARCWAPYRRRAA